MTPRGWDAELGTFWYLLDLLILAFIATDSHYQYWTSNVFTKPWSHAALRYLNFGFSSQSLAHAPAGLGHSGRPGPPLPIHAIGRYDLPEQPWPRTEFCAVFHEHLGCDLGRVHLLFWVYSWYYKSTMIDLEIWTFGIDFIALAIYCR